MKINIKFGEEINPNLLETIAAFEGVTAVETKDHTITVEGISFDSRGIYNAVYSHGNTIEDRKLSFPELFGEK